MTDAQLIEQFHRIELRLERLDTHVDQLDTRLTDTVAVVQQRLEGLEHRLARKADTWLVSAGSAGIAFLLTIYKVFV